MTFGKSILFSKLLFLFFFLSSCSNESEKVEYWTYKLDLSQGKREFVLSGLMKWHSSGDNDSIVLISFDRGEIPIQNVETSKSTLSGKFSFRNKTYDFSSKVSEGEITGFAFSHPDSFRFEASINDNEIVPGTDEDISYLVDNSQLADYENNIDHKGIINTLDRAAFSRGKRIYNDNCINCHGTPDIEGSIPSSRKFWSENFKVGSDLFSMYEVLTKGYASMPPQPTLTPREKYEVSLYVSEEYIKKYNSDNYSSLSSGYLSSLPQGSDKGPDVKPYHPWSDMNYGNFLINTYELVDEETGPERYHSPGPRPYPDEDYKANNFAYKGIAVRLDKGSGGVSEGKAWMMFDHDVMRVAGAWTGDGFIDWDGILLNDRHETYPRTIGRLHFETSTGPGWANPETGTYEDPRFTARDGRQFGPLPKRWTNYKGLYYYEDKVVISYTVGEAEVLEMFNYYEMDKNKVFSRTLNLSNIKVPLQVRIAKSGANVQIVGSGSTLAENKGHLVANIKAGKSRKLKIYISDNKEMNLEDLVNAKDEIENLDKYIQGGPPHYNQELSTTVLPGLQKGAFVADLLEPPFDNPWKSRMKLSGIDFYQENPDKAVVCTVDGDVWTITGLIDGMGILKWKRIASGLFQPLGIKRVGQEVFITCRDQLVRLVDLNGDEETDFYESFNHDHQVTDHFHEFAMGLQADEEGNLYYAKSGRHAREALIPQHGTLIKVNADGKNSEIIATGFRAANGVCINPDGSFIVTDQQGYWNPMNRINWVKGKGNFYGNMWGYNPPEDTSRAAMEPPLTWVDMEFDRSPSELLWVDSDKWGPLNGSLLSLSYGYGKVQVVLNEEVNGIRQGGVIDLPGIKFMTGVMRGRFNPEDGNLYACGMSAWGTSQMMKGGGLYRLRYTGNALPIPVKLNAVRGGIILGFEQKLDKEEAFEINNYEIKTWDLLRSSNYGSKRYNIKSMEISEVKFLKNEKEVFISVPKIKPVDVMTINYSLKYASGKRVEGTVQNTIHQLGEKK